MNDYLINFKNMDWENTAPGLRCKTYIKDSQKIRLAEFSEEFIEEDWCTNGHVGYVLDGKISIDFNGKIIEYKKGDGIFIPEGKENKHKGKIVQEEKALLLLFEKV